MSQTTRWSDVATAAPGNRKIIASEAARDAELRECGAYFQELWKERSRRQPKNDLLSMMAHSDATRDMDPKNLLGNLILLIVGGNDTTRNSLSGSVYALNLFPDQYKKLRENHALVQNLVPETIRWQTPLAHMRRTALVDAEIAGKQIKKGEKVVMWYVSGNRDEDMFANANDFVIERRNPRNHIAFGFGIHSGLLDHVTDNRHQKRSQSDCAAIGGSAIFRSCFPKFSPVNRRINVRGAFSRPTATSSF